MRLCLDCKHFEITNQEEPGKWHPLAHCFDAHQAFQMGCLRGAWSLDIERDTEDDLRRMMKNEAKDCDAYEEE